MTKEIFQGEAIAIQRQQHEQHKFNKWWNNLNEDVKEKLAYAKEHLMGIDAHTMTMKEIRTYLKKRSEKKAIKAKRILNSNASN